MSDIVIKAETLGKKYVIGHHAENQRYRALRDVLMENAQTIWNKTIDLVTGKPLIQGDILEEVWALKDVSFEIRRGEAIGIIGRNGAGKSTLLKILSRITEPSTGRVTIDGRVASLLEVGTGFHPELTGRENIYLNGTILGMTRNEISRKFDEIVAFAEVEKYLDTPVKRYSSGMYVRLAFAVAAHLEPEILLVDEVLAVGDAQFQKKCLGKMGDVTKEGRTVLYVSHQMDMIRGLCSRGMLLNDGSVFSDGRTEKVIEDYLQSIICKKSSLHFTEKENSALGLQIIKGKIVNEQGELQENFDIFDKIIFVFEYRVYWKLTDTVVNFEIKRNGATLFLSFDTDMDLSKHAIRTPGLYRSRIELPCPLLKSGIYAVTVNTGITNTCTYQRLEDVLIFEVDHYSKPSSLTSYADKRPGVIAVPLFWETEMLEASR
ncbi:MAG: ABC transporter ATP-binding protein [Pseudomonadota bacterium]